MISSSQLIRPSSKASTIPAVPPSRNPYVADSSVSTAVLRMVPSSSHSHSRIPTSNGVLMKNGSTQRPLAICHKPRNDIGNRIFPSVTQRR